MPEQARNYIECHHSCSECSDSGANGCSSCSNGRTMIVSNVCTCDDYDNGFECIGNPTVEYPHYEKDSKMLYMSPPQAYFYEFTGNKIQDGATCVAQDTFLSLDNKAISLPTTVTQANKIQAMTFSIWVRPLEFSTSSQIIGSILGVTMLQAGTSTFSGKVILESGSELQVSTTTGSQPACSITLNSWVYVSISYFSQTTLSFFCGLSGGTYNYVQASSAETISNSSTDLLVLGGKYDSTSASTQTAIFNAYYTQIALFKRYFSHTEMGYLLNQLPQTQYALFAYWPLSEQTPASSQMTFNDYSVNRQSFSISTFEVSTSQPGFTLTLCKHSLSLELTAQSPISKKSSLNSISLMNYFKLQANNLGNYIEIVQPDSQQIVFSCYFTIQAQQCTFNIKEGRNIEIYFSTPQSKKIYRGSGVLASLLKIDPISVLGVPGQPSYVTFRTETLFNSLEQMLMVSADCITGFEIMKQNSQEYSQLDLSSLAAGDYILCWKSPLSDSYVALNYFKGIKMVQKFSLLESLVQVPHSITVQTSIINHITVSPEISSYSRLAIVALTSACEEQSFIPHASGQNYTESTGSTFQAIYFGQSVGFTSAQTSFRLCISGGQRQSYFPVYDSVTDTIFEFQITQLTRQDIQFPELVAAYPRYGGSLSTNSITLLFNMKLYGVVNSIHPDQTGKIVVVESNSAKEPILSATPLLTIKISQFQNDISSIPELTGTSVDDNFSVTIDLSTLSLVVGNFYFVCVYPQTLASIDTLGNSMYYLGEAEQNFPVKYCHLFKNPISVLSVNSQQIIGPLEPEISISGTNFQSYSDLQTQLITNRCFYINGALKQSISSRVLSYSQSNLVIGFNEELEMGASIYCDIEIRRIKSSTSEITGEQLTDIKIGQVGCNSPCLSCTISPSECKSCEESLFLYNATCVAPCPAQYPLELSPDYSFYHSAKCVTQCQEGYFIQNSKCEKCVHSGCSSCASQDVCTQCFNNMYLFFGSCVQECPFNSALNSNNECDFSSIPISVSNTLIIVEPMKSFYSYSDSITVDVSQEVANPEWIMLSPFLQFQSSLFLEIQNSQAKSLEMAQVQRGQYQSLTIACTYIDAGGNNITGITTLHFQNLPLISTLNYTHQVSELNAWKENLFTICSDQLEAQQGFTHYYLTLTTSEQEVHILKEKKTLYESSDICEEVKFIKFAEIEGNQQGLISIVARTHNLNQVQKSIQVSYSTSVLGEYFTARSSFTQFFPNFTAQNQFQIAPIVKALYTYSFPRENIRECVFDSECGYRGRCVNSQCICNDNISGIHCQFQTGHRNVQLLEAFFLNFNSLNSSLDLILQLQPVAIYLQTLGQLLSNTQIENVISFYQKIRTQQIASFDNQELTYFFQGLSGLFEAISFKLPSILMLDHLKTVKVMTSNFVTGLFNRLTQDIPYYSINTRAFELITQFGKITELTPLVVLSNGAGFTRPQNMNFEAQNSYFKLIDWKMFPRTSEIFRIAQSLQIQIYNGAKVLRTISALQTPVSILLRQTPYFQANQLVQCLYYQQTMEITSALSTGCVYRGNKEKLILCQCDHLSQYTAIFIGQTPIGGSVSQIPTIIQYRETEFYESIGFILAVLLYVIYIICLVTVLIEQKLMNIRKKDKNEEVGKVEEEEEPQTRPDEIPQDLAFILKQKRKSFILNQRAMTFKDNALQISETLESFPKQQRSKHESEEEQKPNVKYCSLLFNTYAVVDLIKNGSLAHTRSSRLTLLFLKNSISLLICVSTFCLLEAQTEDIQYLDEFIIILGIAVIIPIKLLWSHLHKLFRSSQDINSTKEFKKIKLIWWPLVMALANFIILVSLYFMVKRSMTHRQERESEIRKQLTIKGFMTYVWAVIFEVTVADLFGILLFYKSLGRKKCRCWRNYLHYTVMLKLGLRL